MKHGKSGFSQEAEFKLGYVCRTLEEHLESYPAYASDASTLADAAERVALFFRAKAEALRRTSGAAELLQQMRQDGKTAGLYGASEKQQAVHVATRNRRTLSAAARKRIARAQKLRWAKYRRKQTGSGMKYYWAKMTAEERSQEMQRRISKRAA